MKLNQLLASVFELLYDFYGPQNWWPAETRDEMIIGAILTQNTNWKNVEKALYNLKRNQLCSLSAIEQADEKKIADLIRPSGYYNVKAARLKAVSESLSRVSLEDMSLFDAKQYLLNIKGVGNETSDSILLYGFEKPVFVIDAYTVRLINRMIPNNSLKSYEEYQEIFHNSLSRDVQLYNEFHALIVLNGKKNCRKKDPRCVKCPLIRFGGLSKTISTLIIQICK